MNNNKIVLNSQIYNSVLYFRWIFDVNIYLFVLSHLTAKKKKKNNINFMLYIFNVYTYEFKIIPTIHAYTAIKHFIRNECTQLYICNEMKIITLLNNNLR